MMRFTLPLLSFGMHCALPTLITTVSLWLVSVCPAADVTWNGLGSNNNWSSGLNWNGTAPVANDALFFGGTTRLSSMNDFTAGTSFSGVTFNSGAGSFTLTGNDIDLGGNVTNNSSNLQTLSLSLLLNATRTFDSASGNITVSSVISGSGGLVKTGAQTLTLSGTAANTFGGLTSVNAGVLHLDKTAGINAIGGNLEVVSGGKVTFGKSQQLADTAVITISGATSVFNGTAVNTGQLSSLTETIAGLTMTGGVFNTGNTLWSISAGQFTGGAGNTTVVGNSGVRLNFDSLSLTDMTGTAAGDVAAINSFTLYGNSTGSLSSITIGTGGLTLNNSKLNIRRGGTDALGSKLVLNGSVTTTGTLPSTILEDTAGGSVGVARLELSGTSAAVDRVFNVGAGGANLTVSLAIENGASTQAGIIKSGDGILTFSGASVNTYTGTTTINAGTLVLNKSAGVTAVAGNIIVNTGGTLTLSANQQIADTAGITMEGGTLSPWGRTETIAFYTQNSGGVTASGNSGQVTITGALTLAGGNLFTINSNSIPAHFNVGSAVLTGANLVVGGNNGIGVGRTALTVGSGGLSLTGRSITLYRGSAGTVLNLNGNFTGNGTSAIAVDSLGDVEPELNLGTEVRTFDIASGTTTISVGIVGTGGLTKIGTGTLSFEGNLNNTYTGTTTVSAGILSLKQTAGTHAVTGPVVVSGGTLTLTNSHQIADTTGITVNSGLISPINQTETIAYYTQTNGGMSTAGNTGYLTVTGLVTLSGGTNLTINSGANGPAWNFGGAVLTGTGIILGGNNGASNPKTRLTIGSSGLTLSGRNVTLNEGTAGTELYLLGNLTGSGTSAIANGGGGGVAPELHLGTAIRTFDITSGTTTVGVTVLDTGGINKTGTGILLMTQGSSYSGGTTVTAGTLTITNASGSATGTGALNVISGATLSGTGRIDPSAGQSIVINGALTIGSASPASGEILRLSTSGAGTITVGGNVNIQLFSGQGSSTLNAATTADRLFLSSATGINLSSTSVLNVTTSLQINPGNTAGWTPGTRWQIIDWTGLTGTLTGSFNTLNLPDLSPLGYQWDVSALYTSGIIVVVTPEPGRLILLMAGFACLIGRRRRKR